MPVGMPSVPPDLERITTELLSLTRSIGGYLSDKEIAFLALLAACPTTAGEIVEIGTFKGKSTVVLAKAATLSDSGRVVAVDPLIDPALTGGDVSLHELGATLERHGVADRVEFHHAYSKDLAAGWNRPIRLLWIDGDHSYAGAKLDFDLFSPFLADGAIVALHDVLHAEEGPVRVLCTDILLAGNFGPAGVCGSIGWSQFFRDPRTAAAFADEKLSLYRRLARLVPYVALGRKPAGIAKLRYKLRRWRVPHGPVNPGHWVSRVRFRTAAAS